jgi:hypothetical protein
VQCPAEDDLARSEQGRRIRVVDGSREVLCHSPVLNPAHDVQVCILEEAERACQFRRVIGEIPAVVEKLAALFADDAVEEIS